MPMVRGRFFPEIESTGRPNKCLDVLLWGRDWMRGNAVDLDNVEILREYLRSIRPSFCGIRLLVPTAHAETVALLEQLLVKFVTVEISAATADTEKLINDRELARATQTALSCDADALVVTNRDSYSLIEEIEKLGILLMDTGFLTRYWEIFVRGHEVPWTFPGQCL